VRKPKRERAIGSHGNQSQKTRKIYLGHSKPQIPQISPAATAAKATDPCGSQPSRERRCADPANEEQLEPPLRSRTFREATANPDSRELAKLLTSRALETAHAVGARLRRGPLASGVHGGLAGKGARVWVEGGGGGGQNPS